MNELHYLSQGKDVLFLAELLALKGYEVVVSSVFGPDVDQAVRSFQLERGLVVDGRVGPKTWACLMDGVTLGPIYNKSISDQDLQVWSNRYGLEPETTLAINEVCSLGRGFLLSGRPIVWFHGHVFWKELQLRGLNPSLLRHESNAHVLYRVRNSALYLGGEAEYQRLEDAISLSESRIVKSSAHCASTWGAFQIEGTYYNQLGFDSIHDFISAMEHHERDQLEIFGRLLEVKQYRGRNLIGWLQEKQWRYFALGYGPDLKAAPRLYRNLRRAYRQIVRESRDLEKRSKGSK